MSVDDNNYQLLIKKSKYVDCKNAKYCLQLVIEKLFAVLNIVKQIICKYNKYCLLSAADNKMTVFPTTPNLQLKSHVFSL